MGDRDALAKIIEDASHTAEMEMDYASETGVPWTFDGKPLSWLIPVRIAEAVIASDWLAEHDRQVSEKAWAEGVRRADPTAVLSLESNPYSEQTSNGADMTPDEIAVAGGPGHLFESDEYRGFTHCMVPGCGKHWRDHDEEPSHAGSES